MIMFMVRFVLERDNWRFIFHIGVLFFRKLEITGEILNVCSDFKIHECVMVSNALFIIYPSGTEFSAFLLTILEDHLIDYLLASI